jgi:thioredoxin-like negative regulator of GroEL
MMAEADPKESRFVYSATRAHCQQPVVKNPGKGPVLVAFWARWAGPSLRQGELPRRLASEYGRGFLLVSVDTDKETGIAKERGPDDPRSGTCRRLLFQH